MLSNEDLSLELEGLARQARDLAGQVKGNGDLPPRALAGALVEAGKIGERLLKLGKQLRGSNGKRTGGCRAAPLSDAQGGARQEREAR